MFNKELNIRSSRKLAGVTLELILAITLAVLVLFFLLGIFGDNLKSMVASSRMSNMFDNTQKASYGKQAFDPTQVNVQVLAEQGGIITPSPLNTLDDFKKAAADKINYYAANPPTNEAEVLDLAKWATIARITTGSTVLTSNIAKQLLGGITINYQYGYTTNVGTVTLKNGNKLNINKQINYGITACGLNSYNCLNNASSNQLAGSKTVLDAQYVNIQ